MTFGPKLEARIAEWERNLKPPRPRTEAEIKARILNDLAMMETHRIRHGIGRKLMRDDNGHK